MIPTLTGHGRAFGVDSLVMFSDASWATTCFDAFVAAARNTPPSWVGTRAAGAADTALAASAPYGRVLAWADDRWRESMPVAVANAERSRRRHHLLYTTDEVHAATAVNATAFAAMPACSDTRSFVRMDPLPTAGLLSSAADPAGKGGMVPSGTIAERKLIRWFGAPAGTCPVQMPCDEKTRTPL